MVASLPVNADAFPEEIDGLVFTIESRPAGVKPSKTVFLGQNWFWRTSAMAV
jgi:hypothetical protein